jgi:hypothetical protein
LDTGKGILCRAVGPFFNSTFWGKNTQQSFPLDRVSCFFYADFVPDDPMWFENDLDEKELIDSNDKSFRC